MRDIPGARKERLLTELNNCLIIVTNGLKTKEKEDSDTNIGILDEIQTIENEYLNNEFIDFEIKIIIRLQLIAIIENNIERVINNVKDIVSYFEEKNILVNELVNALVKYEPEMITKFNEPYNFSEE